MQHEEPQPESPSLVPAQVPGLVTRSSTFEAGSSSKQKSAVDGVGQDTAIMLEFLALSRRQIVQDAHVDEQLPDESPANNAVEMLFTTQQVDQVMAYHEECLAWTHNVVHIPTFRTHCTSRLSGEASFDGTWDAMYYAMLAVSQHFLDRMINYLNLNPGDAVPYTSFKARRIWRGFLR